MISREILLITFVLSVIFSCSKEMDNEPNPADTNNITPQKPKYETVCIKDEELTTAAIYLMNSRYDGYKLHPCAIEKTTYSTASWNTVTAPLTHYEVGEDATEIRYLIPGDTDESTLWFLNEPEYSDFYETVLVYLSIYCPTSICKYYAAEPH